MITRARLARLRELLERPGLDWDCPDEAECTLIDALPDLVGALEECVQLSGQWRSRALALRETATHVGGAAGMRCARAAQAYDAAAKELDRVFLD